MLRNKIKGDFFNRFYDIVHLTEIATKFIIELIIYNF